MDELPELPFRQVLNFLSLEDRLKARTVSRAWRNKFDRYPVNTLCYSSHPIGLIRGKRRLVSGAFAENFISSTRFVSFFETFGQTILSNLKLLRLCDLDLSEVDPTAFTRTLNSFRQLEQLDIIRAKLNQQELFNLPMLTSLQLEGVKGIHNLTVEAPRLCEVKMLDCSVELKIVPGESVERLLIEWLKNVEVKKLKNLKVLYVDFFSDIDSTFLSSLQHLMEIHTNDPEKVLELFEQKQRSGRTDLKIYLSGLLLNGPDDPAINTLDRSLFRDLGEEWFVCLAENQSRLADQILFYPFLYYTLIENNSLGLEFNLKRFIDLNEFNVNRPVEDIQRFLDILKNCENIAKLDFKWCDQPQELFDRLPEHCAVQKLALSRSPPDLAFLFRLEHLIDLDINRQIESEIVRRAFDELPTLSSFWFINGRKRASIKIDQPKRFTVLFGDKEKTFYDLNAAIEFIFGKERPSSP